MQFQQVQQAFVAAVRNPELSVPADIDERRMAVYRELLFNNVQSFVASAFPVLQSLYRPTAWQALVRQFFMQYSCSSPYFLHIAEHFLHYLQQEYALSGDDPVFMLELAHYEWAELYLATKICASQQPVPADQVASVALQLSDLALVLAYPFAVHQISIDFQPVSAGDVQCYLLYRDGEDDVKFVLINQLTAALLQQLYQAPGATLEQLVQQLQPLLPQFDRQQLWQGAVSVMQSFAAKGVLMSFQAEQNSLP
ncbi:MAG TPA: putative DNA-binding domain-containing protein [Rheinheimera sp.]|uniref:HvfC family RiPP maturation protein n=1 Tax=Rheinheimera sp. TaxID=1869214 RepID=UPI002F9343A5